MNLYFLLEGEQTERLFYPKWLSFLLPELEEVYSFQDVEEENYFVISSNGIPSIYNHTIHAIQDINEVGRYDYLFVCLDGDSMNVEGRQKKLLSHIQSSGVSLTKPCKLEIIVQHPCIETWFLGNRKLYKKNPQGGLFIDFSFFYNVSDHDPELMPIYPDFIGSIGRFHEVYLREMLKEYRIKYRKSRPAEVIGKAYFDALMERLDDSSHLNSLRYFVDTCARIRQEIKARR